MAGKTKFINGKITHLTMAPEEVGAITRVHCEAEFTTTIAEELGVRGPDDWPEGWKGSKLDIKPLPIKTVVFDPFDQEMASLKFEISASLLGDFKVKKVTREEETKFIITFNFRTTSSEAVKEIGNWMNTAGKAICEILVARQTQKEIKDMEREQKAAEKKQLALVAADNNDGEVEE